MNNLYKILLLLIITVSIFVVYSAPSNFQMANLHFYIFIAIIAVDVFFNKAISLLTIWLSSFIYIILAEMLLASYGFSYRWAHQFIFIANDVFIAGYVLSNSQMKLLEKKINNVHYNSSLWFPLFLIVIGFYFLFELLPIAFLSIEYGARTLDNYDANPIVTSGSKLFPSLVAFYVVRVKKWSKWIAVFLSLPFIFPYIVGGSRFKLLFTLLPFLLICGYFRLDRLSTKNIFQVVAVLFIFLFLDSFIMSTRNSGVRSFFVKDDDMETVANNSDYFSVKVCSHGSSEGVVKILDMVHDHFETHDHTKGISSGFVFYFWVPRSLWKEKPEMLNYWLPHRYMKGISEGYSSSSSFCGELYADFGVYSLFVIFLLGFLCRKGNDYLICQQYGRTYSFKSLFAVQLIPYVFFAVRSPVTASYTTIMQLFMLYLVFLIFFKE